MTNSQRQVHYLHKQTKRIVNALQQGNVIFKQVKWLGFSNLGFATSKIRCSQNENCKTQDGNSKL